MSILHEKLISQQPIYELRRKARKAKRRQKIWTQEEIDFMFRQTGGDLEQLLSHYSQFNLNQRNWRDNAE